MICGRTDDTESVHNFIAHKFRVAAADFGMVEIVVRLSIAYIRGQFGRQFLRLVTRDQVDHVIGNQRWKPSYAFASRLFVVGNPYRGCAHDFYLREVAPRLLRSIFDEAKAPLDEIRIGELQNDAVADASCAT